MSQAASFEAPIDPEAGPREADGFNAFTNKKTNPVALRARSSIMWADQRI